MRSKTKRYVSDIIIFAVLVFLDRITKIWAVDKLKDKDPIELIKGVLELYYLPNGNTGAAFGMLAGHKMLFLLIAIVVVSVIVYLVINMPESRKYSIVEILLIFIAAGGVGNMIDRIAQGYVVDFIYISAINFPIFNVADMYVSVCTTILAIIMLFRYKEEDYDALEAAFAAPFGKRKSNKEK